MKKVRLWCDRPSTGLINLRNALVESGVDCKRIKINSTRYQPRENHLIINWGNSQITHWLATAAVRHCVGSLLNNTQSVAIASNKLKTFQCLESEYLPIPDRCITKECAAEYIAEGKTIYCRTKLTGHSGDGIIIARTVEELVEAPLYTVGIPIRGEYRVHVLGDKVIDVAKKRRRTTEQEAGNVNELVRNLAGGWVFCHNNITCPDGLHDLTIKAVNTLGLDFGAVDIIEESHTGKLYVLEVNSAPGLSSPTTLNAYVNAIKERI